MDPRNFIIAACLGSLFGIGELLSRYRDRPIRLFTRGAAWLYVGVNAAAATAALLLIERFSWDFGQSGEALRTTQVLVAGFGSAVLFRSSLFIFKVGTEDVAVGPSYVLTSMLGAADRSVDRDQAEQRLKAVTGSLKGIDFAKDADALVTACLAAAANVGSDESARLNTAVRELKNTTDIPMIAKPMILGMMIINTVGADVLQQAVTALTDAIATSKETVAALPILKPGASGEQVKRAQGLLEALGFDPGPIDGIYPTDQGSLTRKAILEFQRARTLTADGIVGPQTWSALLGF